jgi:hypothetical protein
MIMVLKLEPKRCADLASSSYWYLFKFKILFQGPGALSVNRFQALPDKENE